MPHYHEALALKQIRLEEGWTYLELATAIGGINAATVHRFMVRPGAHSPLDTTLYRIRRFLAIHKAQARRRQRRRLAVAMHERVSL